MSEPSPQRTPVLYQAGGSPRGREFAARHAECVFVSGLNPERVGASIRETRELARRSGRNPEDILFFLYAKVITGGTEAEVKRKYDDYLAKHPLRRGARAAQRLGGHRFQPVRPG